jgi:hypothetical protein|tara:strand:- start:2 stop:190 length:189 start_codon:yes stop_codon:yes gene_type:complete
MTYAKLGEYIQSMTAEQLSMDVTVYVPGVGDEYYGLVGDYPIVDSVGEENDVLDKNHPYLVI